MGGEEMILAQAQPIALSSQLSPNPFQAFHPDLGWSNRGIINMENEKRKV